MATTMRPCGCVFDMETGKQVTVCLACGPRHLEVMRAAWEFVLRGTSTTIHWGTFQERLSRLHNALLAAGKPEDYVEDPNLTYEWRGIL
jgi:hypothetical protein